MYFVGAVMFAVGLWLLYRAFAQKKRVLAVRAEIAASDGRLVEPEIHQSLKTVGAIFPGIAVWFVAFVAVKGTVGYLLLDGGKVLSPFDLAGFLFLLAGYSVWLTMTSKYREIRPQAVAVPATAGAGEDVSADVGQHPRAA